MQSLEISIWSTLEVGGYRESDPTFTLGTPRELIYKKEFFDLAEQAATARILQGVHYPSDNIAGMTLAKVIFEEIERKVQDASRRTKKFPSDYTGTA